MSHKFRVIFSEAAQKATQKAFELLCKGNSQVVIGIEDSNTDNLIGFGSIFISTDYFDDKFINVPQEQKLWVNGGMHINDIRTVIYDHIRQTKILPRRVIMDNNVVDLDVLYRATIKDKGISAAIKLTDELQLQNNIYVA